jgi:hypothetical protein
MAISKKFVNMFVIDVEMFVNHCNVLYICN